HHSGPRVIEEYHVAINYEICKSLHRDYLPVTENAFSVKSSESELFVIVNRNDSAPSQSVSSTDFIMIVALSAFTRVCRNAVQAIPICARPVNSIVLGTAVVALRLINSEEHPRNNSPPRYPEVSPPTYRF